jgi:hypothetical protein
VGGTLSQKSGPVDPPLPWSLTSLLPSREWILLSLLPPLPFMLPHWLPHCVSLMLLVVTPPVLS